MGSVVGCTVDGGGGRVSGGGASGCEFNWLGDIKGVGELVRLAGRKFVGLVGFVKFLLTNLMGSCLVHYNTTKL